MFVLSKSASAALVALGGCLNRKHLGVVAITLTFAAIATATDFDSRYLSPSGQVHCIVSVDGDSGTYTLDDGTVGTLSNIRYSASGKTRIIRGRWSLGGTSGTFEWRVPPSGGQFVGRWDGDFGGSGYWNGAQINDAGASPNSPLRPR
jgi:hypothetical protein